MDSLSYHTAAILAGVSSAAFIHLCPVRADHALTIATILVIFLSYAHSASLALKIASLHILALVLSTVLYRLSPFHPLAGFPGPIIHRLTSLKNAYVTYTGRRYLYVDELHRRYGPFVRIGPSALSINDHRALGPIYASASAFDKAASYTFGGAKGDGLFFMKQREEHNARRRVWAGAFSHQMMDVYHEVLERRTMLLMDVLEERASASATYVVDLRQALCHWTFDVMGDITFGSSSQVEMLRNGDPDGLLQTGHLATIMLEVIGEIPSLFSLLWYVPASKDMRALEACAQRWVSLRAAADSASARPDIMTFLLAHDEVTGTPLLSSEDLGADAILAIQAGSDTPAGILTYLFFFLVTHPHAQNALHAELSAAFSDPFSPLPARSLAALPYLDAFLTEALRLGAPFAGLPRVVPHGGAVVAGAHVPGGTTVSVPGWSQHIEPAHFGDDALEFNPERWLPGASGGADRTRLMTFSFGPFGCLGEKLALAELQVCLARAVLMYELTPSPDFDVDAFRAGALNARTPIFRVPLRVVLRRRARGE